MDVKRPQVKIGEIFHTMDYGDAKKSANLAKAWLEKQGKCFKANHSDAITTHEEQIYSVLDSAEPLATTFVADEMPKIVENSNDLKPIDVALNMMKLADSVEKQTELICELEMTVRGISIKDTKKSIKRFVEYVRYYSGQVKTKNDRVNGTYFSDQISLAEMGFRFAAMLACQSKYYRFIASPKMTIVTSLLVELAVNSGFPKKDLKFSTFQCASFEDNYGRIPMIIFNNADLDSACHVVLGAVWDHQGTLPESVDTLLVQEDIFDDVVARLKTNLQKFRMGSADDKQADVTYPYMIEKYKEQLDKKVQDAALMGIEVYRNGNEDAFTPTLFIGGKIHGNNVIVENKMGVPTLTVLAFRNTCEAVNLANNTSQSFAASVWSENIGQINEVSKKLNVGTVWVNMHGKFEADVSFEFGQWAPHATFGFEGKSGLQTTTQCVLPSRTSFHSLCSPIVYVLDSWMYCVIVQEAKKIRLKTIKQLKRPKIENKSDGQDLHAIVSGLKKNQLNWGKLSSCARLNILKNVAVTIDKNKDALRKETSFAGIEEFILKLVNAGLIRPTNNTSVTKYDIKSYTESLGAIALISDSPFYDNIITMLALGNVVVVLYQELDAATAFLKEVQKCLPGILKIVEFAEGIPAKLALENDLFVFRNYNFETSKPMKNVFNFDDCYKFEADDFVKIKNVWANCGESFI